ncbi:glycerate kinase [Rhodococcus pseudokoreensis]|uniref:Glycerate kinase n=1 Tax=Rhodococcus pseudokoreensis TaxID=2811421 RepID=A0A974W919_9NOCA|nr:glycerate kinase [Rhodococcus pseudokoreensis]QSE92902.1 glycerate kinase [Rhodococcus pseudokoreensis]
MTRVLVAPDKFKGSLTAAEVADALADGLAAGAPSWVIDRVPVADGGDGTVAAAVAAGWTPVPVDTTGPTGLPVTSSYAVRGSTAVVELASAVGLVLLPGGAPDPLGASTFGLGTVVRHALEGGAREIIVGLGGSASTDGGAGLLQALGVRVLDADGRDVAPGGAALRHAARVDLTGLHPAARAAHFRLACDVDNPLLGPSGATAVYAGQKGAAAGQFVVLEDAMTRWAQVVRAATGRDDTRAAGAGAAGGAAFGAISVLGADIRPGIDTVLGLVDFRGRLAAADLVITGEGSLDAQSLHGKAPIGVATEARAAGLPVLAVCGRNQLSDMQLHSSGISAAYALADLEPDLHRSIGHAAELLRRIGRTIAASSDELATLSTRGES